MGDIGVNTQFRPCVPHRLCESVSPIKKMGLVPALATSRLIDGPWCVSLSCMSESAGEVLAETCNSNGLLKSS